MLTRTRENWLAKWFHNTAFMRWYASVRVAKR